MKDTIYSIQGYKADDDIDVDIFKLCRIGLKDPFYIWISIKNNSGIGTGTDNHSKTSEEAILQMFRFQGKLSQVLKCSLEEACSIASEMKENLKTINV